MITEIADIKRYIFSGHDSFHCRQLWLKKGYDFVLDGNSFNDESAVVKLGVGRNMVTSIRYWMRAFNIIDTNDKITKFGELIFDTENGYDPFLEDEGSLWLLHYQLIKTGISSISTIIFNEFRKEKLFFKKDTFLNYLNRIRDGNPDLNFNENTVGKDFTVFVNLYRNSADNKNIEDSFSGVLSELELLSSNGKGKEEQFYIENAERDSLPEAIVLFTILDNPNYGNSIGLNSLEFGFNSPGSIFALNRSGIMAKINSIIDNFKDITFTDQAGIKELQFKNKVESYSVLEKYYGK